MILQCTRCGHQATEWQVRCYDRYRRLVLPGSQEEPPEFVAVCPDCDAPDPFEELVDDDD